VSGRSFTHIGAARARSPRRRRPGHPPLHRDAHAQGGVRGISTADEGEEGLRLAMSLLPDLVLTNVQMARISGFEMVEKIRRDLTEPCIIFVTVEGWAGRPGHGPRGWRGRVHHQTLRSGRLRARRRWDPRRNVRASRRARRPPPRIRLRSIARHLVPNVHLARSAPTTLVIAPRTRESRNGRSAGLRSRARAKPPFEAKK
jgi:Response regulator receiver domain